MSQTSKATSWSRINGKHDACNPGRDVPDPHWGVNPVPRFAATIDDERVAWFDLHALRLRNVLKLPAMNRLLLGHERLTAKAGNVQQYAAGDDAVGPVGDRAKARTIKTDLVLRSSPVP